MLFNSKLIKEKVNLCHDGFMTIIQDNLVNYRLNSDKFFRYNMNKLRKQTSLEAFGKSFVWQGQENIRTFEDFCFSNDSFTSKEITDRCNEIIKCLTVNQNLMTK
jgi:hypothetical protein